MSTTVAYTLLALGGVFSLTGAIWVLSRIFRCLTLEARTTGLEIAFEGFAAQYQLSNTQNAAVIGKLRRKIARLQGDEEDDEIPQEGPGEAQTTPVTPARPTPFATGSDVLKYGRQQGIIR